MTAIQQSTWASLQRAFARLWSAGLFYVSHLPMSRQLLSLLALLVLQPAFGGTVAYHCEIQQQVSVRSDGKAVVSSGPFTVDRKLSIHRKTGATVGTAIGHLQTEGPRILAEGNDANSFVALWLGPSAGGGVHVDVLHVQEYVPGSKKPFVASGGGTVYVGLCE